MKNVQSQIRNFSIIAHIDHGKSTLADRIIELAGTVSKREMREQMLDNMELERERGITIKLQTSRLKYEARDGREYELNLIDTPGHVDFSYEVSRSLAACEGAILVVDATQGVEAQTLANVYLATAEGLEIVPVLNKIDLPGAMPDEVKAEIEESIGIPAEDAPLVSAKEGIGIEEVLERVIKLVPPPTGDSAAPLRALIFDSQYDSFKGVVIYARIFEGEVKVGDEIYMMNSGKSYEVTEIGVQTPFPQKLDGLSAGEVGYILAAIKKVADARVGDTITLASNKAKAPLAGYKKAQAMVYCGIYPAEGEKVKNIQDALEKLQVNDAAFSFEKETSNALGFGFRCGFLGLLHMEIIIERLEREFDLALISTSPSVIYRIHLTDGEELMIQNPANLPSSQEIEYIEEPIVRAEIIIPTEYTGSIMELCQDRRGILNSMEYLMETRVKLDYRLPLNEVIYDFFDALKSKTRGYGSLDYDLRDYERSKIVKLDIMLNKEIVDAFSMLVHESKAYQRGKFVCEKLKDIIPRHQFEVPIQAVLGQKVIARTTVRAYRKDVIAKCYGGDISRKRKLLEKQKEGKKKMRQFGSVEVPKEAFTEVLKYSE